MVDGDADIEILEPDDYSYGKDRQIFSHKALVMIAIRRCLDLGAEEMREGYWNNKMDKFGNYVRVYIPDARKRFVEAVKTLKNITSCDFDNTATTNVDNILKDLKKSFDFFVSIEKRYHELLSASLKKQNLLSGIYFRDGYLNPKLSYYNDYLNEEAEFCRKILEEINNLTKRLDFYAEDIYEA